MYQTTGCHKVKDAIFLLTAVTNSELLYSFGNANFDFFCNIKETFLPSTQHPTAHRMYKQEICTFKMIQIKCSKIKISYLHHLINKLTKLRFCSCLPPLPNDITNLKLYQKGKTLFCIWCTPTQNSNSLCIFHTFIHKTTTQC